MARGPEIGASAARSLLPSARFNVRSATAAEFGGQEAAGLQQIASAADRLGTTVSEVSLAKERIKKEDQKRLREFTLNTDFIQFATDRQTDLAEAQQSMPGGGWEFQKNFMLGMDERFEEWAESRGLDDQEQAAYRNRFAGLRQNFSGNALQAEFQERERFYTARTAESLDTLKLGIDNNPEGYDNFVAQGEAVIDQSGLTPIAKDERKSQWRREASEAYGLALVQRDASAAMAALGGPVTEAGDFTGPTGAAKEDFDYFRSQGLSGVAAAAALGVLSWESGGGLAGINPNGRNPGDGNDGSDSIGAGQWNGPRAVALRSFAQARGKGWNDKRVQLEFFMHEMKTSEPEAYRRLMAASTIEQAVEAMSYYERPQGWRNGGDPTRVIHWNERVARAKHFAGTVATETRPPNEPADPRLAGLSYESTMRLRDAAGRQIQREVQQQQAAAEQEREEQINALELQLLDGDAGVREIEAARAAGWLTDATDVGRLTNIVEARAKENEDINLFDLMAGTEGTTWNPIDPAHKDAVEAGFARNPTLQNGENIIRRTGIVPTQMVSSLRGALLSTDPARVQQAATIVSNVMAGNQNAFTPVEGGRDLEEAGVEFNRLVNGLGFTATDAAARIAQANDPAVRERVRLDEPRISAFRRELVQSPPLRAIINDIEGPGRGRVLSREQTQAVTQDYADLAMDHFRRSGNADAAQAWARDRIGRLYGRSNGTFIKYPPERVYPAVGGSHSYIYDQAANAVRTIEGRTVEPGDVYLMPLPTVTAESWRRGQPAPYAIHYVFTNTDGQRVYDSVPGGWRPNPTSAASTPAGQRREEDFQRRRREQAAAQARIRARMRQPDRGD